MHDLIFGLLDLSISMFCFLPFFGQRVNGAVYEATLLSLSNIAPYLKVAYFAVVAGLAAVGILTLALQNYGGTFWVKNKSIISLILNTIGILLFIISQQPYAAVLLFVFLIIKVLMLIKQ